MVARMSVIALAPASRAALTVGRAIVTPSWTRATSGTIVTLPLADTVIVCGAGSVAGAPATGPDLTVRAATATMVAPSARAPSVRSGCVIGFTFVSPDPGLGRSRGGDDDGRSLVPLSPRRGCRW